MKHFLLLTLLLSNVLTSFSQPFWTEDFGLGCSQGTLASAYTGTNGAWTVPNTGTNDTYANEFFVSATEAGTGVGNCGDGCLNTPTLLNRTLHIGNIYADLIIQTLPADNGASYNSGGICAGLGICVITDKRIASPAIDCSGKSNITVSFNYMEGGQGTTDNAELWYYDGSTWAMLEDLPKTTVSCPNGQGLWTAHSVQLPSSADNNPNVKIGFRWINNDDATGTDPSFAVDDITLDPGDPTVIPEYSLNNFSISPNPATDKTKITFNAIISGNYSIEFINVAGQIVMKEKIENFSGTFSEMYDLSSLAKGVYLVNLTSPQGKEIRKIVVE
ncbi:MAG: hypothetical protein POELPBGB_03368 [Bacteroidia bacterium]|nr:hypothetical protein [Bacteroidia bacterium]